MTTASAEKTFEEANEERGLTNRNGTFPPFLDLYEEVGNWVIADVSNAHEITYTAKKGKMKGKKVTKLVYVATIKDGNMGLIGKEVTISPAGLLAYQLNEEQRPEGKDEFPFTVGIRYDGKDDEGRNQTTVTW